MDLSELSCLRGQYRWSCLLCEFVVLRYDGEMCQMLGGAGVEVLSEEAELE